MCVIVHPGMYYSPYSNSSQWMASSWVHISWQYGTSLLPSRSSLICSSFRLIEWDELIENMLSKIGTMAKQFMPLPATNWQSVWVAVQLPIQLSANSMGKQQVLGLTHSHGRPWKSCQLASVLLESDQWMRGTLSLFVFVFVLAFSLSCSLPLCCNSFQEK